jgi:hypothetical protein
MYAHRDRAIVGLRQRLGDPSSIHDTDVFAVWILLETAWMCGMWDEACMHAVGCFSMLRYILSPSVAHPPSHILTVFAPLMFDRLNLWATVCYIQDRATNFSSFFPQKLTLFRDRVTYERELQRSAVPGRQLRQYSVAYAIHKTLSRLLTMSTFCWLEGLRRESMGGPPLRTVIGNVLAYVNIELSDPDLMEAVWNIQQAYPTPRLKGESIESQMQSFQLLHLETVYLSMAILSATTEDLSNVPGIGLRAKSLLAFYRREITQNEPLIDNIVGSYAQGLITAGWTLPEDAVSDRKCLWKI